MRKSLKSITVILGAVVLSTVAIQASDIIQNIDNSLSGLVIESGDVCGKSAVQINLSTGTICMDIYESSPSETCPVQNPQSGLDTQTNLNNDGCKSVSYPEKDPWRFVSLTQAQQLCARAGKRLPNNDEWYTATLAGLDMTLCNIAGTSVVQTGEVACVTATGVHDMVGNLWEWIDAEVSDGIYNSRALPESGYVQAVDSDGMVSETSGSPYKEYGDDYATINSHGIRGILRGGFYGSRDDAGVYSQNISVQLSAKLPGVGFRCVKSL